jgi:hypothetical protein
MAITNVLAEVIIPDQDGLAVDEVVNTFSFIQSGSLSDTTDIADFFNGSSGAQAHPLAYYICASRSRVTDACQVRYYDVSAHLDGSPHGGPFEVDTWTLGASGGSQALPEQICVTNSFYDTLSAGGITTGRHRGRIFLGPLDVACAATDSFGRLIPAPAFLADVGIASSRFLTNTAGQWAVWSRRDAAMRVITAGFVEDTFDVQRRRRLDASTRQTWS